ncbi:MAG TPA: folylpolyglutamate synthase/dihydrofolate synthase family protein [Methylomirabilota bacterium]|jgi:dihydrofolate synthase/folylpolyglutamate synthase
MTYAEALARLLALRGGEYAGMRPGLDRIHGLLDALGNPERRYRLVQVGGTNGKGSVAAMIATILKMAGFRVGLYTSPHLVSFRERIRVNGEAISEDQVADGFDAIATLVARADATVFEATTAIALDHFAAQAVDVAVLEVGLGGRLDATTVGAPEATVITSLDLDHQELLGSTLGEIAGEKAAIIRGGLAVSAAQPPEAADVVRKRAVAAGVTLLEDQRDLHVDVVHRDLAGQRFRCRGPGWELDDLEMAMLGTYQPANALLAVTVARHLGASESAIRDGLRRVRWPGRFEVRGQGPWLVLDGAHNPGGARALAGSLRAFFGDRRATFIVGLSREKDARAILAALAPVAEAFILARSSSARAAAPDALVAALPASAPPARRAESAALALAMAAEGAPPLLCVAGSLFLVGDVLAHLGRGRDRPCPIEAGAVSMGNL